MTRERFVVVGDVINDIVVVPRGRIRPDTDTNASVRPRPGGSAANTAAWLGSLGAQVDLVGCVGPDSVEWHEQALREHGVVPHFQVEPGFFTGTIVVIVEGEQRTMLTERGANAALRTDRVTPELLAEACFLHVSGYSVVDGFGAAGARDLIERAAAASVPVSANPGSAGYIGEFGAERFLDALEGAALFFPNRAEGELLTGRRDPRDIAKALLDRFETVVVTLGSQGAYVAARGEKPFQLEAPSVRLVDPTGAGDAFAAGFLHAWHETGSLERAAESGVRTAARAIMLIGGRPAI